MYQLSSSQPLKACASQCSYLKCLHTFHNLAAGFPSTSDLPLPPSPPGTFQFLGCTEHLPSPPLKPQPLSRHRPFALTEHLACHAPFTTGDFPDVTFSEAFPEHAPRAAPPSLQVTPHHVALLVVSLRELIAELGEMAFVAGL